MDNLYSLAIALGISPTEDLRDIKIQILNKDNEVISSNNFTDLAEIMDKLYKCPVDLDKID